MSGSLSGGAELGGGLATCSRIDQGGAALQGCSGTFLASSRAILYSAFSSIAQRSVVVVRALSFFPCPLCRSSRSSTGAVRYFYSAPPGLACCLPKPPSLPANPLSAQQQHLHHATWRCLSRDRSPSSPRACLPGRPAPAPLTVPAAPYIRPRLHTPRRQWTRMAQPSASNRPPHPPPTAPSSRSSPNPTRT